MLVFQTSRAATVTFNGGVTYQVIDGFGVNANYRNWNNDELKPVLDALIDQAGMTSCRVVYELSNWEATNDDANPDSINWTYYNPVYGSGEFTRLWDMFAYLNTRGLTNGAFFNFMGWGPSWMMGSDGLTLKAGMEGEWAEMIASALVYARNARGLQFSLVAPNNEPDIYNEGVHMDATPYVNALHQLALKLDANGLNDVAVHWSRPCGWQHRVHAGDDGRPGDHGEAEAFWGAQLFCCWWRLGGGAFIYSGFGLSRPHVLDDGVQRVVQRL